MRLTSVLLRDGETIFLKVLSFGDIHNLCRMLLALSDRTRMYFHDLAVLDSKTFVRTYFTIFFRLMFNPITCQTICRSFVGIIASNQSSETVGFAYLYIKPNGFSKSATYGLVVRDDYQGRGIGRVLTSHIIKCANAFQLDSIDLVTATDNVRAIALYEKFGFAVEGLRTQADVWKENIFDVYYMVLHLHNPFDLKNNGRGSLD